LIAHLIQIVSKQLYSDNRKIMINNANRVQLTLCTAALLPELDAAFTCYDIFHL